MCFILFPFVWDKVLSNPGQLLTHFADKNELELLSSSVCLPSGTRKTSMSHHASLNSMENGQDISTKVVEILMLQTSELVCYYFFYFSTLTLLAPMFYLIVTSTSITLILKKKERKHCWALFDGTIWQMTTTKAIWITCSGYTVDTPSYIMGTGALQDVPVWVFFLTILSVCSFSLWCLLKYQDFLFWWMKI